MSNYDERLATLEQTSVTRTEFTKAMDNLRWQQGRTLSDRNQETAISLGLLTEDVRILKENSVSMRIRMDEGFADLNRELYSMEEKFEKRFVSLEGRMTSMEEKFEKRFASLEGRMTSMEEKFEKRFASLEENVRQILALLSEKS